MRFVPYLGHIFFCLSVCLSVCLSFFFFFFFFFYNCIDKWFFFSFFSSKTMNKKKKASVELVSNQLLLSSCFAHISFRHTNRFHDHSTSPLPYHIYLPSFHCFSLLFISFPFPFIRIFTMSSFPNTHLSSLTGSHNSRLLFSFDIRVKLFSLQYIQHQRFAIQIHFITTSL